MVHKLYTKKYSRSEITDPELSERDCFFLLGTFWYYFYNLSKISFFIAGDSLNGSERDKRLRPERPKKENPDFDYEFPENLVWVNKEQMPFPLSEQDAARIEKLQDRQNSQV